MTTKPITKIKTVLSIGFLFAFLVGCSTQEPIRIRVTPTPNQDVVAQSSTQIEPTEVTAEVIAETETEVQPTETVEVLPSETPIPPTGTPIVTDGSFGPIVVPNYTPPPTSTPIPTQPATEAPTITPIPITPITTTLPNLPILDREQLGIQLYFNVDNDLWFQLLRRTDPLDVQWIKVQANWDFLQPDRGDQFDTAFSIFESHIQRAHNDGYKVLVSIAKAPDWARDGVTDQDGPPADPAMLSFFLNFMFDRMGDQISAIEIWNEPNLSREWVGGLEWSGAGYMRLFREAYDTVRARYPDMPVVTAGLAPTRAAGAIDDRLFLRQMYQAGLGDPYYQNIAIGVHPYGWGNPPDDRCCDNIEGRGWDDDPRFFFLETLEDYREIMVANGHQNVQMWGTEFGWATWSGLPNEAPEVWMTYNSPQQQLEYTMRAFQLAQELDYVGPMFLWNLNFANQTLIEERNEMAAYSLFVPGLPIRPLYDAIRESPRVEPQ